MGSFNYGIGRGNTAGISSGGSGTSAPVSNPAASSPSAMSASPASLGSTVSDITGGRVSLVLLEGILVGMIAFYFWTRTRQGGG